MAREPMVTRTMVSTIATLMCVNKDTKQVENVDVTLPKTYKDNDAILKASKKYAELGENMKIVDVISSRKCEQLYGVSEIEFMKIAKPFERSTNHTVNPKAKVGTAQTNSAETN